MKFLLFYCVTAIGSMDTLYIHRLLQHVLIPNTNTKLRNHELIYNQGENAIIYLQANKTHTTSIQGKKKCTPSPSYKQKRIYILVKNIITFQTRKNPKEIDW